MGSLGPASPGEMDGWAYEAVVAVLCPMHTDTHTSGHTYLTMEKEEGIIASCVAVKDSSCLAFIFPAVQLHL
mgnify:CR=1 FL=1